MAKQTDEDGEPLPVDPADFPPRLQWEQGAYDLYQLKRTQWEFTMSGRVAFKHEACERLADERGYDLELFAELLRVIEFAELSNDMDERTEQQQREEAKRKNV